MERFRPTRAGVINIWDYVDEEFVFADGRLVLRGHNGSGKTKALEVLFPFVLDGRADARRLDPFSGDDRTMKSNLLYRGQEAEYGYVWMEFARGEPTETVTLVIGMRAHRNRDGVRSSFFVTGRRLGVDFGLLTAESRPLTEKQLKDALEPDAYVKTATEYRDTVDARLFGLGRERYTQLLDLLLALRRPLLAKDLDPEKVSETLASGLSPIDEDLVEQAARDFENLAEVQRRHDDLVTAEGAVRTFLTTYREYLRTHTRNRLDHLRAAWRTAVDNARAVTSTAVEVERAERAERAAATTANAAEGLCGELTSRLAALKEHEAYRAQGDLDLRRERVADAEADIAREDERLERTARHIAELEREADELARRLDHARSAIARNAETLTDAAGRAGIDGDGDGAVDTGEDLLGTVQARSTARRDDIAVIRGHLGLVHEAERDRKRVEDELAEAEETIAERERDGETADAALDEARAAARSALRQWARRWGAGTEPVAVPADIDAMTEAVEGVGAPDAPSLSEVFTAATDDRRLDVKGRVDGLSAELDRLGVELDRLRTERAAVAAEHDDAPPEGDLRTADRTGRPGAPLWRLVRFADDVDDARAAGIEGALYGAGLLTAWVHPDPSLTHAALAAGTADGYLTAAPSRRRPSGPTLAGVLVPEEQPDVSTEVVTAVLESVSLAEDVTEPAFVPAVNAKAEFGYGVHLGARPKTAPEYIGTTNRANRRRARLADHDASIAARTEEQRAANEECRRLDEVLQDFKRARTSLPPTGPIVTAAGRVAERSTLLKAARDTRNQRRRAVDGAVAEVDAKRRGLRQAAAERSMPTATEDVDAVARAVDELAEVARHLHADRDQVNRTESDLADRRKTVARQRAEHAEDAEALESRRREHSAAVVDLTTREAELDAPLKEVLARIEETEHRLATAREEHDEQRKAESQEHDALVGARHELATGRKDLGAGLRALFEEVEAFAPYAHPDLRPLLEVTADAPWPADTGREAADRAAESVAAALAAPDGAADPEVAVRAALPATVPDLLDAYDAKLDDDRTAGESARKSATRMSPALHRFEEELGACTEDYRVDYDPTGVTTVFVGDETGRTPVAVFARNIAERAEEQQALLKERERTVLEDELLTGLTRRIHGRVLAARDLVHGMNADTRSRPMSSGTAIGIRWGKSDKIDDRQRAAADLLERDATGLGPEGLAELRDLLREMIRSYREGHPRATYRQTLAAVLDYRTWYAFELRLAVPGETEVKLTRSKHSQMSGGEKSASIHLPLFAAANALYGSAGPGCPRVIALDEAFAGIDDIYKPELLGLTVKFDLDLFMTGHDLWVHYDTVPMAAHYDMHHDKGTRTVSAMLILWDGVQAVDAGAGFAGNDELAEQLLGIALRRHVPAVLDDTLLAETSPGHEGHDDGSGAG